MFRYISVYVLIAIIVYINAKSLPRCGHNEKLNICGEGFCPPTCCNPKRICPPLGVGPVCTWSTTGGCRCVNGTVRNENNNCVPLSECRSRICPLK